MKLLGFRSKKGWKMGLATFGYGFILIIIALIIIDPSSEENKKASTEPDETEKATAEQIEKESEIYQPLDISCDNVSLKDDISCIFNQAFNKLKSGENAVYDHYYVEKYNQTSIKLKLKSDIEKETIFKHFKDAMKKAVDEKELKELTIEFYDDNEELIDSFSFIGEDDVKSYDWNEVKWNDVSDFAKN